MILFCISWLYLFSNGFVLIAFLEMKLVGSKNSEKQYKARGLRIPLFPTMIPAAPHQAGVGDCVELFPIIVPPHKELSLYGPATACLDLGNLCKKGVHRQLQGIDSCALPCLRKNSCMGKAPYVGHGSSKLRHVGLVVGNSFQFLLLTEQIPYGRDWEGECNPYMWPRLHCYCMQMMSQSELSGFTQLGTVQEIFICVMSLEYLQVVLTNIF